MTSSPMTEATMRELIPGVRVPDADGNLGVVIRLEDACWERTRYRWTHTIFPDPISRDAGLLLCPGAFTRCRGIQ